MSLWIWESYPSLSSLITTCYFGCQAHPDKLITVQAAIIRYERNAMHLEIKNGHDEWIDMVSVNIISPPEWAGKDIAILCSEYPKDSRWRGIGDIYEFSLAEKYLVGTYPEKGKDSFTLYKATTGDIKGLRFIKKTKKKPRSSRQTGDGRRIRNSTKYVALKFARG